MLLQKPFQPKFELGEEQQEALGKITDFILNSKETSFSLYGPAGTGKSGMLSYVINFLEQNGYDYSVCAPTHKAALVVRNYIDRDVITLHSLLALSPKLDIFKLDLRELQFESGKNTMQIPYKGVVIVDEASMINDDLFDLLEERCQTMGSKILFSSDKMQLAPVKSKTYSKVYSVNNKFGLTKIYRQDSKNSIAPILETLRTHSIDDLDNCQGETGSLYIQSELADFIKLSLPKFQESSKTLNVLKVRILAFTNARVQNYNLAVKNLLFGKNEEYNIGELLTAYSNGSYKGTKYYNSMDYIVQLIQPCSKLIAGINTYGYELSIWDPYYKKQFKIFMISRYSNSKEVFIQIAATIEQVRLEAIYCTDKRQRGRLWGRYYELLDSFATPIDLVFDNRVIVKKSFDYGYAQSVHKSQGSNYDEIFIDWRNIKSCRDEEFKRQLQYVAMSRTRSNAYLLL